MIVLQLEVEGSVTTRILDSLTSQTEYGLAVTPIYDEGPGQPMLGEAITGKTENDHYYMYKYIYVYIYTVDCGTGPVCILFTGTEIKLPSLCSVDVVPAPKNLRFSEVTQTSFRATWEHGAPDVALYRIGWTKQGANNFQYVRKKQLSNMFTFLIIHQSHWKLFGDALRKTSSRISENI